MRTSLRFPNPAFGSGSEEAAPLNESGDRPARSFQTEAVEGLIAWMRHLGAGVMNVQ
jgi:hypothetical protein